MRGGTSITDLPFLGESLLGDSRTRICGGGGGVEARSVGEEGSVGLGGFPGVDFRAERILTLTFGGGIYSCVMSLSTGCCSRNRPARGSTTFDREGCLGGVGSLTGT